MHHAIYLNANMLNNLNVSYLLQAVCLSQEWSLKCVSHTQTKRQTDAQHKFFWSQTYDSLEENFT